MCYADERPGPAVCSLLVYTARLQFARTAVSKPLIPIYPHARTLPVVQGSCHSLHGP
ncbi:uncharacterized protein SETTUDRAFT_164017 [Exserohilum turcica Et28A]|uniref:Uncharacterized protein n=1 Tax=Exserohilum turcicum (strain 28A) TaxID=671987 RepID=R0JWM4_EXST2|nr:uncharacterized protein SETTUDRAFT_164017 [Exserohilum turcica Et28A]EOA85358.1 hypothetical protein SETTUDRAFT_164017 [Exserohilum turcica Et28A]